MKESVTVRCWKCGHPNEVRLPVWPGRIIRCQRCSRRNGLELRWMAVKVDSE